MATATTVDLYEGKYIFTLPKEPSDEKEILGYNLKKKEQVWTRPLFPDDMTWGKMTTREQYELVDQERYRMENGVWFFNHGVPTYITGMHYDHLVNATFDFGKCSYYDSHRLDFYFRDYIYEDPLCFGQCTIKPRRYGYSLQEITQQTREAMRDFARKLGMMSNNKDKTYESLFDPLVLSYMERPAWVRPELYMPNGKIPKTELWWNSGSVKKKKGSIQYDTRGNLNSRLIPKPTTVMGYDGNKIHYLTMDEAWKWVGTNPYECWKKQRPCLRVGTSIIGKCSVLSTMGDDDDYAEAIEAGIQMFLDSDPTNRDDNGHTKSGLYHRFISGEYSLFDFSDPYGYINIDQAQTYIHNSRKQYTEGSSEWTFEVRRYPLTLEEAISTANGIGVFDNKRINLRLEYLDKHGSQAKTGILEEGVKGKIHFVPNNNGNWEWFKLPKVDGKKDYSNRWYKDPIEGKIHLMPNPQGVIGYDPVRYAVVDTVSQSLSMAAALAFQKLDYYGNGGANTIAGIYHGRPDDAEIAHYEVFKASKLTGFPVAYERQVESVPRRFIELGAQNLLLHSHYDGKMGFWTSAKTIKDAIDLIQKYWKKPQTMSDKDYIMLCEFIKVLKEAKVIDPKNMTKFDMMVALMQAVLGLLQIKETIIDDNFIQRLNSIFNIIQPKREDKWNNNSNSEDRSDSDW